MTSRTQQIETAMRLVLIALHEGCGHVPIITRGAWWTAARIIHLHANRWGWSADKPDDIESYLEAAGFDREGNIVDYEKFYAHREAYEQKRASKKRNRRQK